MNLTPNLLHSLNRQQKIEAIKLLEEKLRRKKSARVIYFKPYEWQSDLYAAGSKYKQRLLMAANRVGKTYSAAVEVSYHLTGDYPDWWQGVRFDFPPDIWALGVTGEQIRDVVQKELFGDLVGDELEGTGAVPRNKIDHSSIIRSSQTKGLIKEVKVRHRSGGMSVCGLKSYSQGQHVLMGPSKDFIWIDEEPTDRTIYPQCLTRTGTGNKNEGGYVLMTFTPENGMTEIVSQFMNELKPGQWLKNVTWDDAPHLTDETKAQLLEAIPEYQREMRSKGVPLMGSGLIFTVPDSDIIVTPFECPDHYRVINGMDFGWDHPQAHVQLWFDADQDTVYLAREWRDREKDAVQAWAAVRSWSKGVPCAWPHDGLQHEKGGGEVLKEDYRKAGFLMLPEKATWPDGSNSVEAGVYQLLERMISGRFKVFSTCQNFLEEKRLYHRNDKGQLVKERDDVISAVRYAYMMLRNAIAMGATKQAIKPHIPLPIKPIGRR